MNSKYKLPRGNDSKDPMPKAENSQRKGGGNDPAPAGDEKLGQKKAERVPASARFAAKRPGPEQPTRAGLGGNTPVAPAEAEDHGQKKATHVLASQRW